MSSNYCGFHDHKLNLIGKYFDLLKHIALFISYIICIVKFQHKTNICLFAILNDTTQKVEVISNI